nr:MAG TPA: hypothetical protein [Caudoviricetes sp.]
MIKVYQSSKSLTIHQSKKAISTTLIAFFFHFLKT